MERKYGLLLLVCMAPLPSFAEGQIRGHVGFSGAVPKAAPIVPHHNPEVCGQQQPLVDETYHVSPKGGLGSVAIVLGVHAAPENIKAETLRLSQKNCRFAPHVQTATQGATLQISNDDAILHNVHGRIQERTTFNVAMPLRGLVIKRVLGESGVLSVTCDSGHTWMKAYIVVVPHPFHVVTDTDGNFVLQGVPAGTYTLRSWHEVLGTQEVSVDVKDGQTTDVTFTYESPEARAAVAPKVAKAPGVTEKYVQSKIEEVEDTLFEEIDKTKSSVKDILAALDTESRARINAEGHALFLKHCAACHGARGDGAGDAAKFLDIPPRDFTRGEYEFRMTPSGVPARVEDLYRTITVGIPGTPMPPWRKTLTDAQRWLLARYLMTLSSRYVGHKPGAPIEIPAETPNDDASVARGKELYTQMKCFQCHGDGGKGDGVSADTTKDDWGNPIKPYDLTRKYFQGGKGGTVIFRAISTGLSGSPMPSYADSLDPVQRWDLVHYIQSLADSFAVVDYLMRAPAGRATVP